MASGAPGYMQVEVVTGGERGRLAGAYRAILAGEIGGVVIRRAIDPGALEASARRLEALEIPAHLQHAPVVSRLEEPAMGVVARCMRLSTPDDYPPSVAETRALFARIFDHPRGLEGQVAEILRELTGELPVASPGGGDAFAPALVSRLRGGAEIPYHFDNFIFLEDTGFALIKPRIDARTLVNFQVPIQRPEDGGRLELASYHWADFVAAGPPRPDAHVDTPAAAAEHHRVVDIEVGDFLLFDAGRICHRVTPTRGMRERITYVGHTAPLADGSGVAYFT